MRVCVCVLVRGLLEVGKKIVTSIGNFLYKGSYNKHVGSREKVQS